MPVIHHCPNGHPVDKPDLRYCPTCGAAMSAAADPGSGALITGNAILDTALGSASVLLPVFLGGIVFPLLPLIAWGVGLILYLVFRSSRPSFANGVRVGLLIPLAMMGLVLVLALGALAVCFAMMAPGSPFRR